MPTKKSSTEKATPKEETVSTTILPENGISSYFGEMVFGPRAQKQYLSAASQKAIEKAINEGLAVSREMSDGVAEGMKNWALDMGATHYTHWFQPLRGTTAEKHDSFFEPTGIDTGIVHQPVKAAKCADGFVDHPPGIGGFRDIGLDRHRMALGPRDDRRCFFRGPDVGQGDIRTLSRQFHCDGAADADGCPGDEYALVVEHGVPLDHGVRVPFPSSSSARRRSAACGPGAPEYP